MIALNIILLASAFLLGKNYGEVRFESFTQRFFRRSLRRILMISEEILRLHGTFGLTTKATKSGMTCSVTILTTVLMRSETALMARMVWSDTR